MIDETGNSEKLFDNMKGGSIIEGDVKITLNL
jgi:hypothetical protein